MMDLSVIGKLFVIATILLLLAALQPPSASALESVFEIRAKNGHTIVGGSFPRLFGVLNPENSLRIGVELRPGLMIGFESEHGLGMIFQF